MRTRWYRSPQSICFRVRFFAALDNQIVDFQITSCLIIGFVGFQSAVLFVLGHTSRRRLSHFQHIRLQAAGRPCLPALHERDYSCYQFSVGSATLPDNRHAGAVPTQTSTFQSPDSLTQRPTAIRRWFDRYCSLIRALRRDIRL